MAQGFLLEEFDISLVEYTLSLSYEERLLQHERALATYLELEKAGKEMRELQELNDQPQRTS